MTLEHEYAVLGGYNRSHVGRWLATISATISAIAVFLVLTAVDFAKALGVNVNLPPTVLSLVGAGMVYSALYWIFDRYGWKYGPLSRFLKIPNLSGTWQCKGVSLNKTPPLPWEGTIRIVQTWDRLRVYLETSQSTSDSVAAALLHDSAAGYRLMYHYRNHPRLGQAELQAHHGFAELTLLPARPRRPASTSTAVAATHSELCN